MGGRSVLLPGQSPGGVQQMDEDAQVLRDRLCGLPVEHQGDTIAGGGLGRAQVVAQEAVMIAQADRRWMFGLNVGREYRIEPGVGHAVEADLPFRCAGVVSFP